MIPFVVVVRDELAAGATPRALADQDQALEGVGARKQVFVAALAIVTAEGA